MKSRAFVENKCRQVLAVEFGDVRCRIFGLDGGMEASAVVVCKQLLLDAGQGSPRHYGGFVDGFGLLADFRDMTIFRTNADGADAIGSVIQENAEIVLVGGAARPRLSSSKPTFGSEVLEERMQAASPIVILGFRREGARDRFCPAVVVEKSSVVSSLFQLAGRFALEGDDGGAFGDFNMPCSKCAYAEHKMIHMLKQD